jgi:hypothetical protein
MAAEVTGSSPSVGSSKNSTLGLLMNAREIIMRCRMPLEKFCTRSLARSARPTRRRTSIESGSLMPYSDAKKSRFSSADICR